MTHCTITDKEYNEVKISISNALNSVEEPAKSNLLRDAIIATYHTNGGHAFWDIAIRNPLHDNRVVAWKFCHVVHKLLIDGHPLFIQHSMRHRNLITDIGRNEKELYGHLGDGYGVCVEQYTKLIVTKLNFLEKNPQFPGNLILPRGGIDRIAANDNNVYFQLTIEMFDYLDDVISLQALVFSFVNSCMVSVSSANCRFAPLVPCMQDSNNLYDHIVRMMFLLHANIPHDLLNGHRERFTTLFGQLKKFYETAGQVQYFVHLFKAPTLPPAPPNFFNQSEMRNFTNTTPVAIARQESNNGGSNMNPVATTATLPTAPKVDAEILLKVKDELIIILQQELERQLTEKQDFEERARRHLILMNSELSKTKSELTNLRVEMDEMLVKTQAAPILEQKVKVEEERANTSEEKFQKLKSLYTQLRDDHVKLLRQHGDVNSQLVEVTREKEEMKTKMIGLDVEKEKVNETPLAQSVGGTGKEENEDIFENVQKMENMLSLMNELNEEESIKRAEISELSDELEMKIDALHTSIEQILKSALKLNEEKAKVIFK